ncbi:IMP-specific 5'-nucleotidase 1 [Trichomonascus vanleenenianus]|uniref:IMP 5'-nucleotidase n=1 Tax=Trichomonascus vanleenenianus TaxID=2268995 RepID=UPI003ECB88BE
MTTRYRVEYALKSHRRDEFIEWIKGLLAGPFVLHAGSVNSFQIGEDSKSNAEARRRYAEIFFDIERLIENQIYLQKTGDPTIGRLRQLVPSVGAFFTKLPLERAFYIQDDRRSISKRRLVSPSFNDIRIILNTAQAMILGSGENKVKLVTFDGDVTLYDDGMSLDEHNPVIPQLIELLKRDIYVGIVTAAGYHEKTGEKYSERLGGLINAIVDSPELSPEQKDRLTVMGGESNFLFRLDGKTGQLVWIDDEEWRLPETSSWSEENIKKLLDLAELILTSLKNRMQLSAQVIRKKRGVGLVPLPGHSMCREELEEAVLNAQRRLEVCEAARTVQFCAFNGGSDVWVDVGDKRLGVLALQRYLGDIPGNRTLHVGDQFASIGANDFKARMAACTVWIASPAETVGIVGELVQYLDESKIYED